jgi:phosphoribosylformylglycinamidine cyclo-ligase
MDRVFNMGVGMIVVVDPASADQTVRALREAGEHVWILGEVEPGKGVRYV